MFVGPTPRDSRLALPFLNSDSRGPFRRQDSLAGQIFLVVPFSTTRRGADGWNKAKESSLCLFHGLSVSGYGGELSTVGKRLNIEEISCVCLASHLQTPRKR